MKQQYLVIFYIIAIMLACSCNCTQYLKPGEELYTGAKIRVSSPEDVKKKEVRKDLEKTLRPKPNQTILGIRFKLWFYYKAGEDPKKGFKKMLKNKLGEKPVLFNPQTPEQVAEIMVNRLNSNGYFDASVRYKVITKHQKVRVEYTATVTKPYMIKEVIFPQDTNLVNKTIKESERRTLLKAGEQYNLDQVKAERARIDAYLKNRGFYYFNQDYLLFKADSTTGEKTVRLKLQLKEDVPERAKMRYYINNVYLFPGYSAGKDSSQPKPDTLKVEGYHYITNDSTFKPKAIIRSVFIKKGEPYSRKKYSLTIKRLMGMGVFRYVSVTFKDSLQQSRGLLDVFVNMTPTARRSIQVELEAVTKSNNYSGPALTVSLKDRNLFRGAELFLFSVNSSFETQFTGIQKGFNSYEFGANTQLYLPQFLAPVKIRNASSQFVPRTKFDLGFRTLNRVLYFSMNAVNFSYGYTWKETKQKEHTFNPIAINFARLMKTTKAFDDLLSANPYLKKSFEEQFTIGGNYSFTYNSLVGTHRRHQYYFNGLVDVSGNLLNMAQNLITGRKATNDNPHLLFSYRYSQYTKLSTDARYYFVINKNSKIATRILAGAGFPYGNSTTMPYIKQFFSGGSNSIRAFLPRTVGPGTYRTPDSLFSKTFLDKAGDFKLEGNIEYRFTIISALKGGIFVDAGNVWLSRKNDQYPGGEFDIQSFYRQLAVGTGFGFRIDVTFFVLRFDLGMPIRKPFLPEGQRWVFNKIDLRDGAWRQQNLVLNIAIGYPF
ncbi:MAG: BamA/TamA family outer membrane protein [Bacteroidota bacterium]